jgi:ubiquitin carboxyl-terminal hydrolase L3
MIPRPVQAVLLVFPYGEDFVEQKAEDERIAKEKGHKIDGTVMWMKQTAR